jgi:N-acyl-D-amino-acid deacylase
MAEESCRVGIVVMSMSQADVDTVAKLPYTSVISDALYPDGSSPHPRSHGAFPKI